MPFVITAVIKNSEKKKIAESRCFGISDGIVKISVITDAAKKPHVRQFGIRPVRPSKNETVSRYKRQNIFDIILKICSLISNKYRRKKKSRGF